MYVCGIWYCIMYVCMSVFIFICVSLRNTTQTLALLTRHGIYSSIILSVSMYSIFLDVSVYVCVCSCWPSIDRINAILDVVTERCKFTMYEYPLCVYCPLMCIPLFPIHSRVRKKSTLIIYQEATHVVSDI